MPAYLFGLMRFFQRRTVLDWLVSVLWITLLLAIVFWSAWIVLAEKYDFKTFKAVKDSSEFTVESFSVKQFGVDDRSQKSLAGARLHFEPTTQLFAVDTPVGEGVFFSKSKNEWSQIHTTGLRAMATKSSGAPNVIVQQPLLTQHFSKELVTLSAQNGAYQDRFVTASGDVFFSDKTKKLQASQLKYDISEGSVEILGRTTDGKISKPTAGRVRLEIEAPSGLSDTTKQ